MRIAILGGSTTYDTGVRDDAETFPARLQELLNAGATAPPYRVINAGVPGYTSWESLIHLQLRILELEPDIVIVHHATNDVYARLVPPNATGATTAATDGPGRTTCAGGTTCASCATSACKRASPCATPWATACASAAPENPSWRRPWPATRPTSSPATCP